MHGSMLPIGAVSSPKGAMLALVVELLVTALIGASSASRPRPSSSTKATSRASARPSS
jgi:LDH2 family malate/lactate/ureidoglycolate dehydrogenase